MRQQEQLWEISVNIVKDYLSPEILENYGPADKSGDSTSDPTSQADAGGSTGGQQQQQQQETEQTEVCTAHDLFWGFLI